VCIRTFSSYDCYIGLLLLEVYFYIDDQNMPIFNKSACRWISDNRINLFTYFVSVCVLGVYNLIFFYILFSILFWSCSDSVYFFFFALLFIGVLFEQLKLLIEWRLQTVDVVFFIPVYITNFLSNRSSQNDIEEMSHESAKDTTNCYEKKG
jgi:hypothetical protein